MVVLKVAIVAWGNLFTTKAEAANWIMSVGVFIIYYPATL